MDERVKELLEKAKLAATAAAEMAAETGTRLVGRTRQSLKVFDLNNEIELLMREIGRAVYLTHTGVETDEEELQAKLAAIDEKYAAIAAIKAEQEARRTAQTCPVCGKPCDKTDLYCRVCGEKLR